MSGLILDVFWGVFLVYFKCIFGVFVKQLAGGPWPVHPRDRPSRLAAARCHAILSCRDPNRFILPKLVIN